MRIYNNITLDSNGKVISSDSFQYEGSVALLDGGGTETVTQVVEPSPLEERQQEIAQAGFDITFPAIQRFLQGDVAPSFFDAARLGQQFRRQAGAAGFAPGDPTLLRGTQDLLSAANLPKDDITRSAFALFPTLLGIQPTQPDVTETAETDTGFLGGASNIAQLGLAAALFKGVFTGGV